MYRKLFSVLHDDGHEVVAVVALNVLQEGVQLVALVDQVEQDVFEKVDVHGIVLSAVFWGALMLPKSGEIYLLQQFAIFIIFDYN